MSTIRRSACALLAAALLLGSTGCGSPPDEDGASARVEAVGWLDADRYLGAPLEVENLTVWPVYTTKPLDVGEFRTLDEAQREGLVEIREVGGDRESVSEPNGRHRSQEQPTHLGNDESGLQQLASGADGAVVNMLVIENRGELPILVCAGSIVKGGKQDRQIGQDFVVQAKTTVPVDAFCVEPGRWSPREGQADGHRFVSSSGVAPKGVRSGGQYARDQQEVWANVKVVLDAAEIEGGETTLLAATERAHEESMARRRGLEDAVLAHFGTLAEQSLSPVGFAYAVEGKPEAVRAFAHARLLQGQLPAFAKAMALEAELARSARPEEMDSPKPGRAADVIALVHAINEAEPEFEATSAGNWNGYRKADTGFNGACYLPDKRGGRSEVVLTVDWTSK